MSKDRYDFDEDEEIEELESLEDETEVSIDVCPSCGALLTDASSITDGCNDPLGCGLFLELEDVEEDDEEDEDLEELDFEDDDE